MKNLWIVLALFFVLAIILLSGCYMVCDLKKLRLVNSSSVLYDKLIVSTINKAYGPSTTISNSLKTSQVSSETSKIFQLGREIQTIKRETEYIKDYGELPPKTPNFYKRLNVI